MRFPKKSLLLVLALSASLTGSAFATGFSVGATAGMNGFTGDAGEGLKSGLVIAGFGDYMVNDMWAIGVDLSYAISKHEDDGKLAEVVYPGGGLTGEITSEVKVMQFGVHAKVFLPMTGSPIAPYLLAGAGMYNGKSEWSVPGYSEESDDSDPGFRGGVGANFTVNPMFGINAEADFNSIMTEGESTNMYTIRAGVVFKLASK